MLINILTYIVNTACIILGVSATQKFPPPLPKQEESELFKLAKSGNEESRAKLIEHNLRLVAHIIRKYYSAYKNQDDLISIGSIGLIKAIDSFNCDNGARFATYAPTLNVLIKKKFLEIPMYLNWNFLCFSVFFTHIYAVNEKIYHFTC